MKNLNMCMISSLILIGVIAGKFSGQEYMLHKGNSEIATLKMNSEHELAYRDELYKNLNNTKERLCEALYDSTRYSGMLAEDWKSDKSKSDLIIIQQEYEQQKAERDIFCKSSKWK
ncbi:hypothetical protein [Rahnella contaminans]|uniref:hypothetical protein n=1 Tax=Rahnella contaminans TaxID=2703882 RepID=UPI003C309E73